MRCGHWLLLLLSLLLSIIYSKCWPLRFVWLGQSFLGAWLVPLTARIAFVARRPCVWQYIDLALVFSFRLLGQGSVGIGAPLLLGLPFRIGSIVEAAALLRWERKRCLGDTKSRSSKIAGDVSTVEMGISVFFLI